MDCRWLLSLASTGGLLLAASGAAGQGAPSDPAASPTNPAFTEDDLFRFLEDEIEVTTASQLKTKISEVPLAVYVITREEIENSTAIHIADLLRHVPGLIGVNASHAQWAVSMNVPWALNSSIVLMMIDGRPIYTPFANVNEWWSLPFAPEDIDHIEVVLGPSTTVHGSQAMFGVVNFITRDTTEEGGYARVALGGNQGADLEARFGDLLTYGSGTLHLGPVRVRGAAGYERLEPWDSPDLYDDGRLVDQPVAQRGFGNLRLETEFTADTALTLLAGATAHEGTFVSFGPGPRNGVKTFGDASLTIDDILGDEGRLTLRSFYRLTQIRTSAPFHPLLPLVPMNIDDHATLARALYTTPLPFHNRLAASLDVRMEHTEMNLVEEGRGTYWYFSAFVQDEFRPLDQLIISGGVRLETQYRDGLDFTERLAVTPQISLVGLPAPGHALRLTYGQATNYQGAFYEFPEALLYDDKLRIYVGNSDTTRDPIHIWEAGYRGQLHASLLVTASYAVRYLPSRFWLTGGEEELLPVTNTHFDTEETRHSLDVTASFRPTAQIRIDAALTWVIADDKEEAYRERFGEEPPWMFGARAHLSPHERVALAVDLKAVAERSARDFITGEEIPVAGWMYLNAKLSYRFLDDPDLSVYGLATNITDTHFGEGTTAEVAGIGISRVGRRFMLGLTADF